MPSANAIVTMDPNGVIGVDGEVPWRYLADLKWFDQCTTGGAIIMGRRTFESLLPAKRDTTNRLIVTMSSRLDSGTRLTSQGVIRVSGMKAALDAVIATPPSKVWFAGGERVYREALEAGYVRNIDLTLVPEVSVPRDANIVYFPVDLLGDFELVSERVSDEDARLTHRLYVRCRRSQRLG